MHDVLIIGGGVIGLTLAYELARRKQSVAVYDQGTLGQESSWAGAGIIAPGNPDFARTPAARLRAGSTALWPSFSRQLLEETGIDNGFRRCGGLEVRFSGTATELDEEVAGWKSEGVAVERLTPAQIREYEPRINPAVVDGYRVEGMGQIRNPRHIKALISACAARGVALRPGSPILGFQRDGQRVVAVETPDGLERAGEYVVTAGAWSGRLLSNAGCRTRVHPVRGQMVLLNMLPLPVKHVVNVGPRYLVPRPDGRILVGSTEEEAGFEKRNTSEAIESLLSFAQSVVPDLQCATFERAWSGLRPASADGLPYLGRVPGTTNLAVAAGHFRQGLHLSPITAQLLTQLLLGERTSQPLEPFAADRHC